MLLHFKGDPPSWPPFTTQLTGDSITIKDDPSQPRWRVILLLPLMLWPFVAATSKLYFLDWGLHHHLFIIQTIWMSCFTVSFASKKLQQTWNTWHHIKINTWVWNVMESKRKDFAEKMKKKDIKIKYYWEYYFQGITKVKTLWHAQAGIWYIVNQ